MSRRARLAVPSARKAFTLVELLVVMAIVGILVALSLPSLSGISGAGGMNRAVGGIASLLEQARTYAMAHNTYVWVGFAPETGPERLCIGIVAGTTGQFDDLASSAYAPVSKLQIYESFSLADSAALNGRGLLRGMATNGDDIGASQIGSFVQKQGNVTVTFAHVLQYSPAGVATILSDSSSHWIWIALQPVHGRNRNDRDVAVFQVATLTGQVQVLRP